MSLNSRLRALTSHNNDRGALAVWTVLSAFCLLICLGLVVDGGGKLQAKQQAQLVAEEAARGAGQAILKAPASRGTAVIINPITAQVEAQKYLQAAKVQGVVVPTGPATLLITTTKSYQPKVLGLIGIGPQQVIGAAHVSLNRTNNGVGGIGIP